jgi:ketol-acid reductoisomerase
VNGPLATGTVAVLGFGNQGEAHALNLRDAGETVIVGARPGRAAEARARALGFECVDLVQATSGATVAVILLPDEAVPGAWTTFAPALRPDVRVVFAHGFNLLYSDLPFPERADVVLVSPTGPGRAVRAARERSESLPAYLAVHRDGSGAAWEFAARYAAALGCSPTLETTVREETEVDLFGEQAVLCGGMNALVTAAFETLVARGYTPEIAYLECVHQLRYLADLLHERGVAGLRQAISGTALYGDVTRGPRVVGAASREAMAQVLEEVRTGAFAREWKAADAAGRVELNAALARAAAHPMEAARRRALGLGEPDA